ncbi:MAG: 50S ribosomal protein L25 [bacterium]|nr:50S ribosomal protein L25 [bacterium]
MEEIILNGKVRPNSGKGGAHKLRATGSIPGIFYLENKINLLIAVNSHELQVVLKRKPSLLKLELDDGSTYECVIREIQRDPVSGRSVHIDLMGIERGRKVHVQIPVELTGAAYGVRTQGGVLQQTIHALSIECLPKDIPDKVTIDITELKVGSSLHVRDLPVGEFRILDDLEKTVVSILSPRIEKTVTEVEEAATEEVAKPEETEE